jgi:hypothetical protein
MSKPRKQTKDEPKKPEAPKPKAASRARTPFMILLSDKEKEMFHAEAEHVGLPIGTWMRMICIRSIHSAEGK